MQRLLTQTQEYWRISSIYNGRLKEHLSTGKALVATKQLITETKPKSTLRGLATELLNDLIVQPRRQQSAGYLPEPTPLRIKEQA